jgi:cytochrome c peroxidase
MCKILYQKSTIVILLIAFILSCKKDNVIVEESPVNQDDLGIYNPTYIEVPSHPYLPPMHILEDNPLTQEGVSLGKKLYYDDILSTNGLSCSSCHVPSKAYSESFTGPNGMQILPHFNLGWYNYFGWTGGDEILDHVPLNDLADGNIFLNANSDSILNRFKRHATYKNLFYEAFGIDITSVSVSERKKYIAYALSQFIKTMVSFDSKFDRYLRGELSLTQQELNGFDIFMREDKGDCFHCHGSPSNPLWTDNQFHNNGLDSVHTGMNIGRYSVTNNPNDIGKFRTPSLRNLKYTAPYMHDGRFNTLEEVIEHYSSGLKWSPTIDPLMKKVNQGGAQLTLQEKIDLKAFLLTLSDSIFINNPAYQN